MSMTTYCLATTMVIMILMYLVIVAPPHFSSVLRLMRCDPQHAAQSPSRRHITNYSKNLCPVDISIRSNIQYQYFIDMFHVTDAGWNPSLPTRGNLFIYYCLYRSFYRQKSFFLLLVKKERKAHPRVFHPKQRQNCFLMPLTVIDFWIYFLSQFNFHLKKELPSEVFSLDC